MHYAQKMILIIFNSILILFVSAVILVINFLICMRYYDGMLHLKLPVKKIVSYDPGPREEDALKIWDTVLKSKGHILREKNKIPFIKKMHVNKDIPLKWNPYPPYLGEFPSGYHPPSYSSIIVLDKNNRKYQISIYFNAETDSGPSFISSKVLGEDTYHGDIETIYLFVHDTAEVPDINFYEASWEVTETDASDLKDLLIATLCLTAFQIFLVLIFYSGRYFTRQNKL